MFRKTSARSAQNTRPSLTCIGSSFIGVPPWAIAKEMVRTRCCGTGAIQTFWRFGVLVHGRIYGKGIRRFALLVKYSPENRELGVNVYGDASTSEPWGALAYGLSATLSMVREFPCLRWRAHMTCAQRGQDISIKDKVCFKITLSLTHKVTISVLSTGHRLCIHTIGCG